MLIGFVGRHDVRCFSVATASPRIGHQGWKIQRGSPCFSIISYPKERMGASVFLTSRKRGLANVKMGKGMAESFCHEAKSDTGDFLSIFIDFLLFLII